MLSKESYDKLKKKENVDTLQKIAEEKGVDAVVDHLVQNKNILFDQAFEQEDWLRILTADKEVARRAKEKMRDHEKVTAAANAFRARVASLESDANNAGNRLRSLLATHREANLSHLSVDAVTTAIRGRETESAPTALSVRRHFHPDIPDGDGEKMEYVENFPFENWDGNVKHTPQYTFFPKTVEGIKELVKWAKSNNLKIRGSGYRHTSSELLVEEGQIAVSLLDLNTATRLPANHPARNPNRDLQKIELVGQPFTDPTDNKRKQLCKIGAAVCNYHFQDWVHDPQQGNKRWALPMNVVMTEITFGGSNAPICHGAGLQNLTLSDIVHEIEFVNFKGELQRVNAEQHGEQIKAAAGCFGMLGIVVSVTLKLNQMTYANLSETVTKKPIAEAIPLPVGYADPRGAQAPRARNPRADLANFENQCANFYYSEWFWFVLQDNCWVNCWHDTPNGENAQRFPSSELKIQWDRFITSLAHLGDITFFRILPGRWHANLMGKLGLLVVPDKPQVVCTIEDAEHFRHGIQNIRAKMVEFQIPIPNKPGTNQPDWSLCQRAWWDAIACVYEEERQENFPLRLALEMRVMGGSNVLMAPQYGNQRTCSIEVVTPTMVDEHDWTNFVQKVLNKWSSYTDEHGQPLKIRPHWAKRHEGGLTHLNPLTGVNTPMREYLKQDAFAQQIPLFLKQLEAICKAGGYELSDIAGLFSNEFLRDFFNHPNYNYRIAAAPASRAAVPAQPAGAAAAMSRLGLNAVTVTGGAGEDASLRTSDSNNNNTTLIESPRA